MDLGVDALSFLLYLVSDDPVVFSPCDVLLLHLGNEHVLCVFKCFYAVAFDFLSFDSFVGQVFVNFEALFFKDLSEKLVKLVGFRVLTLVLASSFWVVFSILSRIVLALLEKTSLFGYNGSASHKKSWKWWKIEGRFKPFRAVLGPFLALFRGENGKFLIFFTAEISS